RSTVPRKILDELLAPHRLRAVDGPRGTLLIVRASRRSERAASTPTPKPKPALSEQIVVTPSRFDILADATEHGQFLSRDEVRSLPHPANDLYRAIAHVPGITSNDITARPNIRGGA